MAGTELGGGSGMLLAAGAGFAAIDPSIADPAFAEDVAVEEAAAALPPAEESFVIDEPTRAPDSAMAGRSSLSAGLFKDLQSRAGAGGSAVLSGGLATLAFAQTNMLEVTQAMGGETAAAPIGGISPLVLVLVGGGLLTVTIVTLLWNRGVFGQRNEAAAAAQDPAAEPVVSDTETSEETTPARFGRIVKGTGAGASLIPPAHGGPDRKARAEKLNRPSTGIKY